MLSTSRDLNTSGLKDAILDFILQVKSYNNTDSPIGLLDLDTIVMPLEFRFYPVYKLR